jgi:hypothetical protein
LHFSFSFARFGHLPVPSKNFGGRGKKISKSFPATADGVRRADDIARGLLQRKIEEMNLAEKGSELEKR